MTIKYISKKASVPEFVDALEALDANVPVEFDIETFNKQGYSALDPFTSEIRTMQFGFQGQRWVLDNRTWDHDPIASVLHNPRRQKLIHNAKFEKKMCKQILKWDIKAAVCTLISDKICTNGLYDGYSLAAVVERRLGVTMDKTEQKSDWSATRLSRDQIIYAGVDVKYLTQLWEQQKEEIIRLELQKIWQLEHKVLDAVVDMELHGVYVDLDTIKQLRIDTEQKADDLLHLIQSQLPPVPLTASDSKKKKLREQYPDGVKPPTSNRDFKLAYEQLGVAVPRKFDKKAKMMKQSLSAGTYHLIDHPTGQMLSEHGKIKKILTSYLNAMPSWVHPITGKVHGDINQLGTTTGRMSMAAPNLQNIPVRSKIGKEIRKCFVAPPGYEYLKIDYSQLELRIAAIVFDIRKMVKAYTNGADVHIQTATAIAELLGNKKTSDQITKEERTLAKGVNFGTLYGQYAKGLKDYLWTVFGIEVEEHEADLFIQAFYTTWPEVPKYHERIKDATKNAVLRNQTYTAKTIAGRKKFWGLRKMADGAVVHQIPLRSKETEYGLWQWTNCNDIINMPVQGSGGDGMKYAQVAIHKYLKPKKSKMVLQVHDELGFYIHKREKEEVVPMLIHLMVESMAEMLNHRITIEVEASMGKSWGELTEVDRSYYGQRYTI